MIAVLVGLAVKFRALVIGLSVVVLGLGMAQLRSADVDTYPDFAPPQVQVQAEALGLSAAEVEQLITVPLEQDLLNGVPWLHAIDSESLPGLSTIDMRFDAGTDLLQARQMVQEHLTQAHALPQVGTPPVMVQPTAATGRVLMVALGATDLSLVDLSILARWKIKPRLEGLPGVANVAIWGQRDRQLQVQVDPAKLRRYGVSLQQVVSSTGNALWVSPLTFVEASTPGTGGFIDTTNQRLGIQHVTPITTAKSLSQVTIEDTGKSIVQLRQVSSVVEGHQPLVGDAVVGDRGGLMLVIQKFPGADTREVTEAVEDALDDMRPGLSGITIDTSVYRPASYIDSALHNLGVRALAALLLLVAVLLALLLSWRLALLCFVSVSLSVVGSAWVLYLVGATFDVMTIGGMVAASCVLVSEAVRGAEVFRRGTAVDTEQTLIERTRSTRAPLVYATLVALLLPVPALALDGVAGSFARSAVAAYALSVAVAAVVAHLTAPALGSLLWRGRAARPAPVLARLERGYDRLARRASVRRATAIAVLALLIAGAAVVPQLGSSRAALPTAQDRALTITWQAAAGTSLPEMSRMTTRAVAQLRQLPGVTRVGAHIGRALMADQPVDVDSAQIWANVAEGAPYDRTVAAVRQVMDGYPGMRARLATYPADRIAATQRQEGDAPVVVRVYGPDQAQLAAETGTIRALLSKVPGVGNAHIVAQPMEPDITLQVDLPKAQRYGLTPGDVRRASATLFAGLPVGSLYEDQKIFDVVVWGIPNARRTPEDVADLLLDVPGHGHVRLGAVAKVRMVPQPTAIKHDDISKYRDVTASVSGRDIGDVISDVRDRLERLPMANEFHAEVRSGELTYDSEHWRVTLIALAVLVAILLLLQLVAGSWRTALMVLVLAPAGAVGSVLAAPTVGGITTAAGLLGTLAAVAAAFCMAVPLVRAVGDAPAVAAARRQVVPVTLTALLTAAVLLPFALAGAVAGTELLQPLAVVALAGLVTALLSTLLVLPAVVGRAVTVPRRETRRHPHPQEG